MQNLSDSHIDDALARARPGLEKYLWLQDRVWRCDVASDGTFQRRFKGFYRVRHGESWCGPYFALLEAAKTERTPYEKVLRALRERTGRVEASFASKLVATVDPSLPVVDRFVLKNMGLRLPYPYMKDREARTVRVYEELRTRYARLLASDTGRRVRERFDRAFPNAPVSELKKVDLVLWQHRSGS